MEAMERKPGNEIEKDDVDTSHCEVREGEVPMFLESEEEEAAEEDKRRAAMAARRNIRGKETRRLAMIEGQVGCGSAQQFVDKVETQQEEDAWAFRGRLQEIVETGDAKGTGESKILDDALPEAHEAPLDSFEFTKPRRHSVFYPPGMQDLLETPHIRRASLSSNSRRADTDNGGLMAPDARWLKAYNSAIGKAHFVERRHSVGKGGVLHARVQKKICGRRGM